MTHGEADAVGIFRYEERKKAIGLLTPATFDCSVGVPVFSQAGPATDNDLPPLPAIIKFPGFPLTVVLRYHKASVPDEEILLACSCDLAQSPRTDPR